MHRKMVIAVLGLVVVAGISCADTVYFENGEQLSGDILDRSRETVVIRTSRNIQEISRKYIRKIILENTLPTSVDTVRQKVMQSSAPENDGEYGEVARTDPYTAAWKNKEKRDPRNTAIEYAVRIAPSFFGTHTIGSVSSDVNVGYDVTGMAIRYLNDNFGVGLGATYQMPRQLTNSSSHFGFIPVYACARVKTIPNNEGYYQYITSCS
jgi:hypothetical protein